MVVQESSESNTGNFPQMTWKQFLEEQPINATAIIKDLWQDESSSSYRKYRILLPTLRLFCREDSCRGLRFFTGKCEHYSSVASNRAHKDFITYVCNDCGKGTKTYCVMFKVAEEPSGAAVKLGELPEQHTELSPKLIKTLDSEYSYFVKGTQCEKLGLGIAAFAYYRRVVEAQKARLIDDVLDVAKLLNLPAEVLQQLETAKTESSFKGAVERIKDAIPQSLFVMGQNPLKLIYKALSDGLHDQTDEKCLELAHAIRVVVTDLSERVQSALSDKKELEEALKKINKFNSKQ